MKQDKIQKLAEKLPSLKKALGLNPFNERELDAWGASFPRGTIERCSVQFVLYVCDPFKSRLCDPFNLTAALITWDDEHRDVFAAWVKDPWWM
jgi:hypothetical protein